MVHSTVQMQGRRSDQWGGLSHQDNWENMREVKGVYGVGGGASARTALSPLLLGGEEEAMCALAMRVGRTEEASPSTSFNLPSGHVSTYGRY